MLVCGDWLCPPIKENLRAVRVSFLGHMIINNGTIDRMKFWERKFRIDLR